jgi:hypothetical protein
MKSRQVASVDKSKKATNLLESGLVFKAFQKLRTQDNSRVVTETIASNKILNPTRNTPFQAWNTDQIEPPTMLQEIFPSQVQRAINSLDAETNPGLMQFRGEHLQDLIGKKKVV